MDAVPGIDKWASPTTQVFAFIGILFVTLKIFSFWRLIASLFILPGVSVRSHAVLLQMILFLTIEVAF